MLIAVGIADVVRRMTDRCWVSAVAALAVVVGSAALTGLWDPRDIVLLEIAAGASVAWVMLCARAERTGEHELAPLIVFAVAVALLVVLSGWASEAGGLVHQWSKWVDLPGVEDLETDRLLMVVAVVLLQIVTGNQLVRLVLGSVNALRPAGQPQPSDRLKGGRLLGPMERLLILGLGLAGQLAAATAVIAAKSIIRFPELNAQSNGDNGQVGIDDVTEYFLVGSFASWIVALGGLVLAR
jgi:hypothetical protein